MLHPDFSRLEGDAAIGLDFFLGQRQHISIHVTHESSLVTMEPAPTALLVLQKAAKFRETAGPATLMPVARRNIEELLVQHVEFGAAARVPEGESHQRFTLRR